MKIARRFLVVAGFAFIATSTFADWYDDVRLGTPEYGGTGCPDGTAAVAIAPDAQSLSILFDQFVSEAGGSTGRTLDRKNCNIAVPVHVPPGYSVSIFQIDFRGYNSLPIGAYSRFNVEYFFAGTTGPVFERQFNGPLDALYNIHNTVGAATWSNCGEQVILRANTSMMVRTNSRRDDALGTVDSADVSAGLIFNLVWRRCQ